MPDTTTPAGREDYFRRLAAIREDPQVKRLALARARDRELAEDALQQTCYLMAKIADPERIEDLRAYFCRVLIRAVYALRAQPGAVLPGDIASVADACQGKARAQAPPRPMDETLALNLLARGWLERFTAERDALTAGVPGRSPDPDRYRELIVSVAEQVLRGIVTADVCDADSNPALRTVYPEWFDHEGDTDANAHQRLSRARADVRSLLRRIISRDDLYP